MIFFQNIRFSSSYQLLAIREVYLAKLTVASIWRLRLQVNNSFNDEVLL